jgi:hypothetical protein
MRLHAYDLGLPLDGLVDEARRASADWDWDRGAYGHALSLPDYRDLHPWGRYSYENFPCTARLDRFPLLRGLFDSFQCEKVSFRLLRRGPRTAYAWHADRAKGPGVVRVQVPIVSGPEAFLVTTDYVHAKLVRGSGPPLDEDGFARFAADNAGHFMRHALPPGRLYYFDTTRVHTLVNPGAGERLTLAIDLALNAWLRARFPETAEEAGGCAAGPPRPGALSVAVAYACSRAFPLRNWARSRRAAVGRR